MDKTSSFRCVKFSLVAGNSAVIVMGICGFIIGLIDPPFMQLNDWYSTNNFGPIILDYGPQLALVSCIAVVIGTAGLIGALREHFALLVVYALCIVGVFIFRLTWWVTSQLHQEKRFILDINVSITLLTFLTKLFLLIFAILEALTIQNSLPLTKKKFLMLRSKLQAKTKSSSNGSSKHGPPRHKPRSHSKSRTTSPSDNNIYITSNSIYGSGRRRSPVRMNGHNGHHHSAGYHANNNHSSRARKYLPNPVLNSSPDQGSDSSHDSNNNKNNASATQQNVSLAKSGSPLVIDTLDQVHRVPRNLSNDHYFRFQSPSPSTPTSVKESLSRLTNQPYQVYPREQPQHHRQHSHTLPETRIAITPSSKSATLTSSYPTSRVTSPPTQRISSTLSPSSTLLLTTHSTTRHTSTPSSYTESSTPSYPRPSTLSSTKWSTPTPVPKPLSSTATNPAPSSHTTSSRDYQKDRATFFTSPPASYSAANLFNYSSLGTLKSTAPLYSSSTVTTTSTTASNLNQTRNLFSTYTSPLSTTSASSNQSPAPVSTPSFLSTPYRSTLPTTRTVTSPLAAPRSARSPLTVSSSVPASQQMASNNYLQLSLGSPTHTTTTGSTSTNYSRLATTTSTASKTTGTPSSTSASTGNIFARLGPNSKNYQDYVRSYRYPSEQSTSQARASPTSPTSPTSSRTKAITDRTTESYSSMKRSGSMGADLETTTTYLSTTTQHRQMTERESVYYRETLREG